MYQLSKKMEFQFQKLGKPNGNHVMFDIYLNNQKGLHILETKHYSTVHVLR